MSALRSRLSALIAETGAIVGLPALGEKAFRAGDEVRIVRPLSGMEKDLYKKRPKETYKVVRVQGKDQVVAKDSFGHKSWLNVGSLAIAESADVMLGKVTGLGENHRSLFQAMPHGTTDYSSFFAWSKVGGRYGARMMEKSVEKFKELGFEEVVSELNGSPDGDFEEGRLFRDEKGNELFCYRFYGEGQSPEYNMRLKIASVLPEE